MNTTDSAHSRADERRAWDELQRLAPMLAESEPDCLFASGYHAAEHERQRIEEQTGCVTVALDEFAGMPAAAIAYASALWRWQRHRRALGDDAPARDLGRILPDPEPSPTTDDLMHSVGRLRDAIRPVMVSLDFIRTAAHGITDEDTAFEARLALRNIRKYSEAALADLMAVMGAVPSEHSMSGHDSPRPGPAFAEHPNGSLGRGLASRPDAMACAMNAIEAVLSKPRAVPNADPDATPQDAGSAAENGGAA